MRTEVESHPFELDTMLFMDWRDSHTQELPAMREANEKLPTFLYAMPFTKNKVRGESGGNPPGDSGKPSAQSPAPPASDSGHRASALLTLGTVPLLF